MVSWSRAWSVNVLEACLEVCMVQTVVMHLVLVWRLHLQ